MKSDAYYKVRYTIAFYRQFTVGMITNATRLKFSDVKKQFGDFVKSGIIGLAVSTRNKRTHYIELDQTLLEEIAFCDEYERWLNEHNN